MARRWSLPVNHLSEQSLIDLVRYLPRLGGEAAGGVGRHLHLQRCLQCWIVEGPYPYRLCHHVATQKAIG